MFVPMWLIIIILIVLWINLGNILEFLDNIFPRRK